MFCFCLSGPGTYYCKDDDNYGMSGHITSINWIKEDIVTFKSFIEERHHFSDLRTHLIRLFTAILLFIVFFNSERLLVLNGRVLGYEAEYLKTKRVKASMVFSTIYVLVICLFSKISITTKHIFNMVLCILIVSVCICYAVYDLMSLHKLLLQI